MHSGNSHNRDLRRLVWNILRASYSPLSTKPPAGYESLVEALTNLIYTFPDKPKSWFFRAVYRVLKGTVKKKRGYWIITGLLELGDTKPTYIVTFSRNRYYCSCYTTMYGAVRQKQICTHVAALILYRRQRKITEY